MKWKYILKRILIAIPTFFGITILAYFILNMAPGSPLDALLADLNYTASEQITADYDKVRSESEQKRLESAASQL